MSELVQRARSSVMRSAKDIADERWRRQTRQADDEQIAKDAVAEKTIRLRQLRLARDAAEKAAAEALPARPKRKRRS